MRTLFFTGAGDKGKSEVGGKNFPKSDPAFELLGNLDELNSFIGFARAEAKNAPVSDVSGHSGKLSVAETLKRLQEFLFIAQAETAAHAFRHRSAEFQKLKPEHVAYLEEIIGTIDAVLPPLTSFVVPGEDELSARLDVARTAARRAEREAARNEKALSLSPDFLRFLNRLSSVLFALARYASHEREVKEDNPHYR